MALREHMLHQLLVQGAARWSAHQEPPAPLQARSCAGTSGASSRWSHERSSSVSSGVGGRLRCQGGSRMGSEWVYSSASGGHARHGGSRCGAASSCSGGHGEPVGGGFPAAASLPELSQGCCSGELDDWPVHGLLTGGPTSYCQVWVGSLSR